MRQKNRSQFLTYQLDASILPYVRVGSPVVVPVNRRQAPAVVWRLTRRIEPELKSKVRSIVSVDKQRAFRPVTLKMVETVATSAAVPVSTVANVALTYPEPLAQLEYKAPSAIRNLPIFVSGHWQYRAQTYAQLLTKAPNSRAIIVVAEYNLAQAIAKQLTQLLGDRRQVELIKPGKGVKQTKKLVETSQPTILVGALSDIWLPLKSGDALIVDQPEHSGNKYEQTPYLTAKAVALTRARLEGLRLILGGNAPTVSDFGQIDDKQWRLLQQHRQPLTIKKSDTLEGLVTRAKEAVKNRERWLIFCLAKNWASTLICGACGQIVECPNCQHSLAVTDRQSLSCRWCGYRTGWPSRCTNCTQTNWQTLTPGLSQIDSALRNASLGEQVAVVQNQDKPANRLITLATERIFSFPYVRFDHVVVNLDRLVVGTRPSDSWQVSNILTALTALSGHVEVQTRFINHPLWSQGSMFNQWLKTELIARKRVGLPPLGTLATLHLADNAKLVNIETDLQALTPELTVEPLNKGRARLFWPHLLTTSQRQQLADTLPPGCWIDLQPSGL